MVSPNLAPPGLVHPTTLHGGGCIPPLGHPLGPLDPEDSMEVDNHLAIYMAHMACTQLQSQEPGTQVQGPDLTITHAVPAEDNITSKKTPLSAGPARYNLCRNCNGNKAEGDSRSAPPGALTNLPVAMSQGPDPTNPPALKQSLSVPGATSQGPDNLAPALAGAVSPPADVTSLAHAVGSPVEQDRQDLGNLEWENLTRARLDLTKFTTTATLSLTATTPECQESTALEHQAHPPPVDVDDIFSLPGTRSGKALSPSEALLDKALERPPKSFPATTSPPPSHRFDIGRPTTENTAIINEGVKEMINIAQQVSNRINRPLETIAKAFMSQAGLWSPKGLGSRDNKWNNFLGLFKTQPELVKELCQMDAGKDAPKYWPVFRALLDYKCLLVMNQEIKQFTEDENQGDQQETFQKKCAQIQRLFPALSMSADVEGFFGLVGAVNNKDKGIYHIHCTPSAQGYFLDRLNVTEDAVIVSKASTSSTSRTTSHNTSVKPEPSNSDDITLTKRTSVKAQDEMTILWAMAHGKLSVWFQSAAISIGKIIKWNTMVGTLVDAGLTILDWGFRVPLFWEGRGNGKKSGGIRDIGVEAMRDLIASFDGHTQPRFVSCKVHGPVRCPFSSKLPLRTTLLKSLAAEDSSTAPSTTRAHVGNGHLSPAVRSISVQQGKRRREIVLSDDNNKPLASRPIPKPRTKRRDLEVIHAGANLPPVLFKDDAEDQTFIPSDSDQDTPRPCRKKVASLPLSVDDESPHGSPESEPSPSKVICNPAYSQAKSTLLDIRLPGSAVIKKIRDPLQLFTQTPKKAHTSGDPYTKVYTDINAIPIPPDPSLPLSGYKIGTPMFPATRATAKSPPFPAFLQQMARSQSAFPVPSASTSASSLEAAPAPVPEPPLPNHFAQMSGLQSQQAAQTPAIPFGYQTQPLAPPAGNFGYHAQPSAPPVIPFTWQLPPTAPAAPFAYQAQSSATPLTSFAATVPSMASFDAAPPAPATQSTAFAAAGPSMTSFSTSPAAPTAADIQRFTRMAGKYDNYVLWVEQTGGKAVSFSKFLKLHTPT
ncbi:hypothetical protein FA15DRAFT_709870 [Coprinopsis marcescibilis]|uniref:Uncharacterized protein n=1 Tax=Coprinopsis marcescibilis TaxID=230819 RepID=A0A5C3KEV9_COPMA|nr:hypothetical protein FA15DRAFT_709870 [Coprinopsis marcescibilis]